jgi:hypothetical protein
MVEKQGESAKIEEMQKDIALLKMKVEGLEVRLEELEAATLETKKKLVEIEYELSQKPDRDEVREIVRDEIEKIQSDYVHNKAGFERYITLN